MGADNLECHAGICREVGEFDPAQKGNPVFREGVGVDNARMLQDLLQETDAADGLSLYPPCFTVSRILAQVPLGAGLREVVLHFGVNLVDKMLQLGRNLVVSLL